MNAKPSIVLAFYLVFANHNNIQILWLCFALGWGTAHLLGARSLYGANTQSLDGWSFGQILPVILLTLPILSIAENCYGGSNLARTYGIKLANSSRNLLTS